MASTILLDIEGTTTPLDFVHKTLFPFAKERIEEFVASNFHQLTPEITQLEIEHANETEYEAGFDKESARSVSAYFKYLIDIDRKSAPLKSIQGLIWQQGYEANDLISEMFNDVPVAFERWHTEGRTIAIYSSGSILAQKLLFKYTQFGDLTPFISHYFDTSTGGKHDVDSYRAIALFLKLPPPDVLFISDLTAELAAAREAGMSVALSVRPGNTLVEDSEGLRIVTSLKTIV